MGTTCIIGVDNDLVLKDFIRAHVELLRGEKVCVDHWYPDFAHDGKTIRYFYSSSPVRDKLLRLLPQALYDRWVARSKLSYSAIHDALSEFFRQHGVNVILAEFGPAGADISSHARDLGIPLIVHFHGHDAHRRSFVERYHERYRAMFDYAFRIVSVSHFMTDALIELGADPERIVYNPYGPRDYFFNNTSSFSPTILSLGRFTDIKANYLTLAAFQQVLETHPEAKLIMAGDGELLESCKTLARVWGIEASVSFPGPVPHSDILPLFSDCCCFVQHSVTPSYGDAEGTPVAILEAGAAGLPVVSTRHAGISDAVIHGQTGFLVEEGDIVGMAGYIRQLVGNRDLCLTMGENARHHIRSNYNIDRHIARLQEVIDLARASS